MTGRRPLLGPGDRALLLRLLRIPTVAPLETGPGQDPATGRRPLFGPGDRALLLRLLRTPTVAPLETGPGPGPGPGPGHDRRWPATVGPGRCRRDGLRRAQRAYARAARAAGFRVVHHAAPPEDVLHRADVPAVVRRGAAAVRGCVGRQPG
ncbi:hypothetical protein ACFV8W_44610, partial [Streptomyces sp. NPDC059786]